MAKYQDYVKDDLSDEIDEAAENQEVRQKNADDGFQVPTRFKGKSPEEIARAYVELERLQSRQAQDLGSMRKTVDELVALQSQTFRPPEVVEDDDPVTIDSMYDDAEGAISKVANKAVGRRIEALESELKETKTKSRLSEFEQKHPNWQETATDAEFLNWVSESPYRQRLAASADQWDFDAAEDLFGMYADLKGRAKEQEKSRKRKKQLDDASLESSSPSVPEHEETFSRRNLLQARVSAKKGNKDARQWLADNQDSIALAYAEGRIID